MKDRAVGPFGTVPFVWEPALNCAFLFGGLVSSFSFFQPYC